MNFSMICLCTLTSMLLFLPSCSDDEECTPSTWFQDADNDGLGNPSVTLSACDQPSGYVPNRDDDNDICSGTIDACGVCDGMGETTWYQDADSDGLGNPEVSKSNCTKPDGYVKNNTDTDDSGTSGTDCTCSSDKSVDRSRGACNQILSFSNVFSISATGSIRVISSNNIPNHKVGLFGGGMGSLNPNAISEQNETYTIQLSPTVASSYTQLLSTTGRGGPQYSFGVLLNGVELDPVAAEPFPHQGIMSANANWEWNLEALNVNLGLDCSSAHVQPTGKYHYHGSPTLFLENLNLSTDAMNLIGYAADGFPIYYKYAYTTATDSNSSVSQMTSSYQLKSGCRPGDGNTAPCGTYDGVYSNDYEYVEGLGTLDKANGRTGVTPEYPSGTYYYVLTDEFPSIPRMFRCTPSNDFKLGM